MSREPARRVRRRPTAGGQLLSAELILRTSLRLIELHGPEGLSMRRLGAALGADATAVYRYFPDKHALLLAVADELIGRTFARFRPTGDWLADLRTVAALVYQVNLAHPRAAPLVTARVTGLPNEVAAVETILGILRGAGFPPAEAVRHYHCFISLVLAFAALDSAVLTGDPTECGAWRQVYAELPADRYPHIAEAAGELVARMPLSPFQDTLDQFLSALAR